MHGKVDVKTDLKRVVVMVIVVAVAKIFDL
jgi:hypothetical protein